MKNKTKRITALLMSCVTTVSALSLNSMAVYADDKSNMPDISEIPEIIDDIIDIDAGFDDVTEDPYLDIDINTDNDKYCIVDGEIIRPKHYNTVKFGIWDKSTYSSPYKYKKYDPETDTFSEAELNESCIFYEITPDRTIYFYGKGVLNSNAEITGDLEEEYNGRYFKEAIVDSPDIVVESTGVNAASVKIYQCANTVFFHHFVSAYYFDPYALQNFYLPGNITEIHDCFSGDMQKKNEYILPSNLKVIGKNAFQNNKAIEELIIPANVTHIGKDAFYGCENLSRLAMNRKLETIEENAFVGSGITKIVIPESIKKIHSLAFIDNDHPDHRYTCKSLMEVSILNDYGVDEPGYEGASVFSNIPSIKTVTIGEKVKKINHGTFSDDISLSTLTLSEGLEEIDNYAFSGCSSLTEVDFPESLREIGESAFERCDSLTSVTIPDNVTRIQGYAFSSCGNLSSVTLPDKLEYIGCGAFNYSDMKEVEIPASVKGIGSFAFYSNKLDRITIYNRECELDSEFVQIPRDYLTKGTIIRGYRGSTAEEFAKENNCIFEPLDEEVTTTAATTTTTTVPAAVITTTSATSEAAGSGTDQKTPETTVTPIGTTVTTSATTNETDRTMTTISVTFTTAKEDILYGDANCDGGVDLADAVIIMQSIANPSRFGTKGSDKTHITVQGTINGDCCNPGDGITLNDALAIQKYQLGLIDSLPEKK